MDKEVFENASNNGHFGRYLHALTPIKRKKLKGAGKTKEKINSIFIVCHI